MIKRKRAHHLLPLLILLAFTACAEKRSGQSGSQQNTVYDAESQAYMIFDTLEWNFGTIVEGEQVVAYFDYLNTGKTDLIIRDVNSACGCTRVNWDEKALPPGGRATINVIFDASGRMGSQYKNIRIYSNAANDPVTLKLRASVKANV